MADQPSNVPIWRLWSSLVPPTVALGGRNKTQPSGTQWHYWDSIIFLKKQPSEQLSATSRALLQMHEPLWGINLLRVLTQRESRKGLIGSKYLLISFRLLDLIETCLLKHDPTQQCNYLPTAERASSRSLTRPDERNWTCLIGSAHRPECLILCLVKVPPPSPRP